MKINRILLYALLALPTFTLQSCLKDQDDLFDDTAAARMEKYLDEAAKVLQGSEYGWSLDYYPGNNQQYGGYSYTMKFNKNNVEVGSDLAQNPATTLTSLYKFTRDDGAVLSFDSYNEFIHYFATPNSDETKAKEGDFEFVIDSIGTDVVKVHGKRNQNVLYFRKLTKTALQYRTDVDAIRDNFYLKECIGSVNNAIASISFNDKIAAISDKSGIKEAPFCFTDKGIRFYQPVDINGKKVSELNYDDDAGTLTVSDDSSSALAAFVTIYSTDDDADQETATIFGATQATVDAAAASWLHATLSGNTLNISIDANTTGHPRSGKIAITLIDGSIKTITVNQAVLADVLGTYTMKYTNAQGNAASTNVVIDLDPATQAPRFTFTVLGSSLVWPATWDEDNNALTLSSGEYLGTWRSYYVYSIFADVSGNLWTAFNAGIKAYFKFDYTENGAGVGSTTGTMGTDRTDIDINGFYVQAFKAQSFTSANNLGYIEKVLQPVLVK